MLTRFPVESFPLEVQRTKQNLFDEFQSVVERLESHNQEVHGVSGEIKNLIFAANGPKPEIVLVDATTNTLQIVKNAEFCLIYDRELGTHGLTWGELVDWWCDLNALSNLSRKDQSMSLYNRLKSSLGTNDAELLLFTTYYNTFYKEFGDKLLALIPQVYLHYDPYTMAQLGGSKRLPRQRMDFLLLLPSRNHIVLEVDGKQHYSQGEAASPPLYSEMVAEDRKLKLAGYEVFRFGGYELFNNPTHATEMLKEFFNRLFQRHDLSLGSPVR